MKRGFTLIELLIVIAIIAILALIAIPNFLEAQTRAKVTRAKADMRSIATAIEAYFVDNNSYPIMNRGNGYATNRRERYCGHLWLERPNASGGDNLLRARAFWLTTPIAYMGTRPPLDPFDTDDVAISADYYDRSYFFYNFLSCHQAAQRGDYSRLDGSDPEFTSPVPMRFNGSEGDVHPTNWAMLSGGPDRSVVEPRMSDPTRNVNCYLLINDKNSYGRMCSGETCPYDPTNGTMSRGNIWRLQGQ